MVLNGADFSERARTTIPMPQCVMEGEWEFVQLEPFVHQVGGHSTMLRYSDSTVCKMLNPREYQFYKTMPAAMKEFTPQYRGVIEVSYHEDSDGYIALVARPPSRTRCTSFSSTSKSCEDLSPNHVEQPAGATASVPVPPDSDFDQRLRDATSLQRTGLHHRFRIRRTGSVEIDGIHRCASDTDIHDDDEEDEPDVLAANHNTWSLRCHREQLSKMLNNGQKEGSNKFILLENLTSKMELPCILDLKMGTRQHGDDATEAKRLSQINKCHLTTSSNLGVRICGMQVYRANTGKYICHNKYYGRRLDVDGVRQTLRQFLFDGYRHRVELIPPIIDRLQRLLAMLSKQSTFRFYSSSLLVMYDGSSSRTSPQTTDAPLSVDALAGSRRPNAAGLVFLPEPAAAVKTATPRVDVRMIDFAHATHQGFLQDKTAHVGPDHGYLFGLQNLIHLFKHEVCSTESGACCDDALPVAGAVADAVDFT